MRWLLELGLTFTLLIIVDQNTATAPVEPKELTSNADTKDSIDFGKWKKYDVTNIGECGRECLRMVNGPQNSIPKPIKFIARYTNMNTEQSFLQLSDIVSESTTSTDDIGLVELMSLNMFIVEPPHDYTDEQLESLRKGLTERGIIIENDETAYLTSFDTPKASSTISGSAPVSNHHADNHSAFFNDHMMSDNNIAANSVKNHNESSGRNKRNGGITGAPMKKNRSSKNKRNPANSRKDVQNEPNIRDDGDGNNKPRRSPKRKINQTEKFQTKMKNHGTNINQGNGQAENKTSDNYSQSTTNIASQNGGVLGPSPDKTNPAIENVKELSDDYSDKQWYITVTQADEAIAKLKTMKRRRVTVCTIDTGVDYNNKSLQHAFEHEGSGESSSEYFGERRYGIDAINETYDPMDIHGHGTGIAGLIAGMKVDGNGITGINPTARLIACKAFDNDLKGRLSDILKCIDYCIKRKAQVQNHSWTLPAASGALMHAFKILENMNVLSVVSSGNMVPRGPREPNIRLEHVVPATYTTFYSNILSVAGMQQMTEKNLADRIAQCKSRRNNPESCVVELIDKFELYSKTQYGLHICQVLAPAKNIYTLGLNNTTIVVEGTSYAAGIMSGVSSILLSPIFSNETVGTRIVPHFIQQSVIKLKTCKTTVRWGGYVSASKCLQHIFNNMIIFQTRRLRKWRMARRKLLR
ncbi:Peptidases_S8_Subtilisin_like amily protein [Babesia bovis T2Bo]|uniref:subtilisin n=1 Tax=Babesia bovis TaxID=5865 RepID=A7AUE7_BABBO|nr:Peptidases_S8_Subtilisin_like amily protein [Babesia bovis T2Bo]EDO06558.1 Peptidases_S8_Subtilisin_like amily protein [Babesia bovis T2Bo]|eukprot:XP_001610126.1 subtilisin-like protein [Babesia bovis T2Bo]